MSGCSDQTQENDNPYTNYELSTVTTYQGVSIFVDKNWEISSPEPYYYYIHIDDNNSHFSIQTSTKGDTKDLDTAWKAYTTGDITPEVSKSWSEDGIDYQLGKVYNESDQVFWLMTGIETATNKGFFFWLTPDGDTWSEDQSEKVFDDVSDTLTYNPSLTFLDYHEAAKQNNPSSASNKPSSTTDNASEDDSDSRESITSGTYKVGKDGDIPAGEYKLTATSGLGGYYCVTESSAPDADIVGNDNFDNSTYVTVSDGDYLKLSDCVAELVD